MQKINLLALAVPALLAFTVLSSKPNKARNSYPSDYFAAPVSHTLLLSGTFGELRPNHFHAGIDIKSSKGMAGDPIYSAGDGYISRIKVDETGYGNSLYVSHPNGYTTVYAHLDRFSPEVEAFVKSQQYAQESFEIDEKPGPDRFPVGQGQQIGVMGNTGSSNGVHLHFEVRETSTQNPINPLLFGFNVLDRVAPKMHSLKIYSLNEKREERAAKAFSLLKKTSGYRVSGVDTLVVDAEQAGFGLKVYDHFDRVSNWNGIYSLAMYQDDSLVYEFQLESFGFDETRYINAHCDYVERITKNSYYNRCYTLPGNQLSIYSQQSNFGVVKLSPDRASKVRIVASDVAGNASHLEFWVKRSQDLTVPAPSAKNWSYILPFNEGNMIQTDGIYLHMPPGTLYQDLYLDYKTLPERSTAYSLTHHLHDSKTPIHDYFTLGIRPTVSIPAELKPKVFVAYLQGGRVQNCGGKWEDGFLRAEVRGLGDYAILADTVPPTVKPVAFGTNMKGYSKMAFKIGDNVATASNVQEIAFDARVDGAWVLMEYDKKSATITHQFEEGLIGPGSHTLELTVRDAVGNETVFKKAFTR